MWRKEEGGYSGHMRGISGYLRGVRVYEANSEYMRGIRGICGASKVSGLRNIRGRVAVKSEEKWEGTN